MRAPSALLVVLLTATVLAGCLGGDGDVDSQIPRAVVQVTEVTGKVDTFLFDASKSTGRGLKFDWDFGDKTTSKEEIAEHTYDFGAGVYPAKLTITDTAGITDVWEEEIKVGDGINLPPIGLFTPSTRYLLVNEPLKVDARATTDEEGDPIRYEWDFNHIMTEDEYIEFREAKMDADYENEATVSVDDEEDNTSKSSADTPRLPDRPDIPDLINGEKDAGHGNHDSAPPVSLFNGMRSTTDPVFTLQEGFPDPTVFYVRLVAFDVKGAAQAILSEEIWPVKVVEVKKAATHEDSQSGTFQLGSPAQVQEATPNNEETAALFDDDLHWTFEIPDPIDIMYVNVTWTQSPAAAALSNDIDLTVESPNGKERKVHKVDESISLELTRHEEVDTGTTSKTWGVDLFARSGVNTEYTVSYWAKVDLNPFRALEAPYVVEDVPRDGEE